MSPRRIATSPWSSRATRSTRTCRSATTSRSASSSARCPRSTSTSASTTPPASSQLEKLLDRKPKELSGGQRQRVALGRAIVREPAVFLMDEPLSNLDAKLRVQTRAEIARLHQRLGTTMVYVTHDQVEAMTMGQRIAVMSDGLLQQVGTPAGPVRPPDEPVRRRLHRQPVDELHRDAGRPRRPGSERRVHLPDPATVPREHQDRRDASRRGLPAGAPRDGRHRQRRRHHPRHRGRRRVPRQRGAPPRDGPGPRDRGHRGLGAQRPPGDNVQLRLPVEKLHLFNIETGDSLIPPVA